MLAPTGKPLLSPVPDKGALIVENNDLKIQIATLKGTVAERDGTISALTARVTSLETENGQLKATLSEHKGSPAAMNGQVVSLDTAAANIEAMEARLGQEADPQKIVILAREIDAMKSPQTPESRTSRRHLRRW